jgi:hypothetical protein
MIQPDTINSISKSATNLPDSLAKLDSITTADSLHLADSLTAIIQIPQGFIGIPHPSIPQTENWVFVFLMLLFFLLIYSVSQSSGYISDTIKTFFQIKERSSIFSKATVNDSRFRFLLILFSIFVLSLYVYFFFRKTEKAFTIHEFLLILLATGLFLTLKFFIFNIIGYVFLNRNNLKVAIDSYFNTFSFLGLTLYPLLFLQIYLNDGLASIVNVVNLIVIIIASILVIFKLFQIFFQKILDFFYILLYLCTLEILPLIILIKVYKMII